MKPKLFGKRKGPRSAAMVRHWQQKKMKERAVHEVNDSDSAVNESNYTVDESPDEQINIFANVGNGTAASVNVSMQENPPEPYSPSDQLEQLPSSTQPRKSKNVEQPEKYPDYIIRINPILDQLIKETHEKVKIKSEILFKEILEEKLGKVGKLVYKKPTKGKVYFMRDRSDHDYCANFVREKGYLLEEIQTLKLELKLKDIIIDHKKKEISILKDKLVFCEELLLQQNTDTNQEKS